MEEDGKKSQSKSIHRDKNQGNARSDSDSGEIFGSTSRSSTPKPIGTGRAFCQGTNFLERRESVSGGILRQLIGQAHDQVAVHLREVERLNSTIKEWEMLLTELERRIAENPFDGN